MVENAYRGVDILDGIGGPKFHGHPVIIFVAKVNLFKKIKLISLLWLMTWRYD